LSLELLVLADIGRDHLFDLPRAQQLSEPFAVDPGVVAGDREVFRSSIADCIDQPLGNAAQAEPAGANLHAVKEQTFQRGGGGGILLLSHGMALLNVMACRPWRI